MAQDQGASVPDRAATPSEPSPAVSGVAGIPCAFTPGPWVLALGAAHPNVKELRWVEVSPRSCFPLVRDFMAEADARLIAAAPELYESTAETYAWVRRIQDVMTGYLVPDGYDADEALNKLIEMLDGPEQREIQGRAFAALAAESLPDSGPISRRASRHTLTPSRGTVARKATDLLAWVTIVVCLTLIASGVL